MAIRMMTSKEVYEKNPENIEVIRNYPGCEADRLQHVKACPHYRADNRSEMRPEGRYPDCVSEYPADFSGRCAQYEPLYMQTTHIGLVLSTGERNGYDDSDFYAVVWNEETQATQQIEYASTRGWTYPNGAAVDATPEVIAKSIAYSERMQREHAARLAVAAEQAAEDERIERERTDASKAAARSLASRKGTNVKVRATKKSPIVEGQLFWIGVSGSGKSVRIGVRVASGDVIWTNSGNLQP